MASRTLLLSSWFFPLRVVSWQDAVRLIYSGDVDILAEYDEEIRSPSVTWKMPAVVRLRRTVPKCKARVRFSRGNVFLRDLFTCQYCGEKLPARELTYDHVVPRSRGGRTQFENIVSACKPCNSRKGNLTCDEAGMFPRTRPVRPRTLPLGSARMHVSDAPLQWAPYLIT